MGVRWSGLHLRLVVLVLAAILPALGLILWNGLGMRRAARESAHQEARRLARIVQEQQTTLVHVAHQMLSAISRVPAIERGKGTACEAFSAEIASHLPQFGALLVVGPDGRVTCGPDPASRLLNLAGRDDFRRALHTREFSTGTYLADQADGEAVLPCADVITNASGDVRAVVTVELRLRWLEGLVGKAQLPEGSQVTVFDPKGTVLARYPDPGSWVGQSASGTELGAVVARHGEGTMELAGLDGVQRLCALMPLRHDGQTSAWVTVGIPAEIAYAESRTVLIHHLTALGVAAMLALAIYWILGGRLLVRPVETLARAARSLEAGELSARVGALRAPGELGLLARTFDRMAESLQHREAEREANLAALRRQEELLRSAVDSLTHPFFVINVEDYTLALANQAAHAAVGAAQCFALLHGRDKPCHGTEHPCPLEQVIRERRNVVVAHQRRQPGREPRYVDIHAYPLFDEEGEITQVIEYAIDVTERRRSEEALRRTHRALKTLATVQAAIGDGADEEDLLRRVCCAVVEVGGYRLACVEQAEEDEGRTLRPVAWAGFEDGFLQGAQATWADEPLGRGPAGTTIRTGQPSVSRDLATENRFRPWRDEALQRGFASILAVPLNLDGRVVAALSIFSAEPDAFDAEEVRLLTEVATVLSQGIEARRTQAALRRSEEQLRQAQRLEAVGRLAGGVAHDFNNLLQVILGTGEILLQNDTLSSGPASSGIREMIKCGERAAHLTRQLLAFSRRQVLDPRVLDPNSVVAEMEKMLRRLIGEDVALETRLDPGIGRIKVDPGQLEQVLVNLAVNARDAMPQGGKLTIETEREFLDEGYASSHAGVTQGRYALIAVSDTGHGMDPVTLQRIFEPFFTTKEPGKGTGLGLATVYGIVRQSAGNIWVYSEPNEGTTFKVYLPEIDETPESSVRPPEPGNGDGGTVLLVEDEASVRQAVRLMLEYGGYTVLEADGPTTALALVAERREPIDLLLTDVVMPEMGGRALAEEVRSRCPQAAVLFMSGYTDNAIVHHGVPDSGIAYLQKPFGRSTLLAKIQACLRPSGGDRATA